MSTDEHRRQQGEEGIDFYNQQPSGANDGDDVFLADSAVATRTVTIGKRVFNVPVYPDLRGERYNAFEIDTSATATQMQEPHVNQPITLHTHQPKEIIAHRVRRKLRRPRTPPSIVSLPMSSTTALSYYTVASSASTVRFDRSKWSLFANSLIMFGREFCYAIEAGLTTPILLSIGLPDNLYSLVWVISPVLGFVLQPIVGSLSDKCRTRWGRRRPFILALAILLLIGMTFFLNGENIIKAMLPGASSSVHLIIFLTVFGVVVFDFSADFIEGPIRAYLMDVCNESDVRSGLFYQAVLTGFGGAFGYASGGVAWVRDLGFGRYFPSDRQVVFFMAALIFILCLALNLTSIAEKNRAKKSADSRKDQRKVRQERKHGGRNVFEKDEQKYAMVDENQNDIFENKISQPIPITGESHQVNRYSKSKARRKERKLARQTGQQIRSHRKTKKRMLASEDYGSFQHSEMNNNDQEYMAHSKWKAIPTRYGNTHDYEIECVGPQHRQEDGTHNLRPYRFNPAADSDSTTTSESSSGSLPSLRAGGHHSKSAAKKEHRSRQAARKPYRKRHRTKSRKRELSPNCPLTDAESAALLPEDGSTDKEPQGMKETLKLMISMPKELKCLCFAHLLGWMGFLCVVLFFTDYVGQEIYGGDPHAPPNSAQSEAYKKGVEMGSWGMTVNAAASCLYCFFLKATIGRLGARVLYVFGYFAFAVGALGMALWQNSYAILGLSSLIGVMSGTLYTMPYFLVAQYHEGYKELKGTSKERGVGADCALVTCMIQLAQIVVGLGIGGLVVWLDTVTVTVAAGSVISFLGTIWVTFWVKY